jgi:hypothetical protein
MPGAPADLDIRVVDLLSGSPVADPCLRVHPIGADLIAHVTPGTCDATALHGDANGTATTSLSPGGLVTVEIFEHPDADTAFSFRHTLVEYAVAGPGVRVPQVAQNAVDSLTFATGGTARVGGAHVVSTLFDCSEHLVFGAIVRVADPDGNYLVEGSGEQFDIAYTNGHQIPLREREFTHVDAASIAFNIEPDPAGRPFFYEQWGRLAEGEPPVLLSCTAVAVLPDAVSILAGNHFLRVGGPTCPGLRR